MNTDIVRNIQRINKKCIYISLSLFLLLILFFILIRVEVFKSMDFSIQKSLQPKYPDINNKVPRDIHIIYHLNTIFVPYIIIIIVNNYSNIYKTFTLFQILSVACYTSCILKFIFFKMIMNNDENSMIYYCGEGWNMPSTEMLISVVFYLTLWNQYFDFKNINYVPKRKKFFKYLLLFIIVAFNITNLIILTKIGYYLFSHLLFSAILGILIYLFVFETNIIKKYNSNEFGSFIKKKFELYIIINVLLIFLSFLPYNIERYIKNNNQPECIPIKGSFFYKSKSPFITYVDDTYSLISIFFAHTFVVIGIKCELAFFFGNNILNFEQYHFGVSIDDLNLEKELKNNTGTIIVTRETEWNNTSLIKSSLRLIITFILAGISFLPYYLIKKDGVDFSTIFLIKYFLSYALFSFGITFLYKIIFRIFRLTNEILRSILNDQ